MSSTSTRTSCDQQSHVIASDSRKSSPSEHIQVASTENGTDLLYWYCQTTLPSEKALMSTKLIWHLETCFSSSTSPVYPTQKVTTFTTQHHCNRQMCCTWSVCVFFYFVYNSGRSQVSGEATRLSLQPRHPYQHATLLKGWVHPKWKFSHYLLS